MKVYQKIASKLLAIENCKRTKNTDWEERHTHDVETMVANGPSGSGIDHGTAIDWDKSTPERLIFRFGYHHMNEGGMYDGWTEHTAVVTPSLSFDYNLRITGRDRNQIKEYLADVYSDWLNGEAKV